MQEIILAVQERVSRELDLDGLEAPLELSHIYGNANPVELEIGVGKGLFLLNAARRQPKHNFLGIEIRRKYLNKARERLEKRPVDNARLIRGEAFSFMERYLAAESLFAVHLYFPDPWPKKRHHKRRMVSPAFLELVDRVLRPGGLFLIATDHRDYWEWIRKVLASQKMLVPGEIRPEPPEGAGGLTNYEIKYQMEGRSIYRTGYRKSHGF